MEEQKAKFHGRFAVFHDGGFVEAWETFDLAARMAIKQFQRDCYLIREVGASFTEAQTAFHKLSVVLRWRLLIAARLLGRDSLAPLRSSNLVLSYQ